MRQHQYLQVRIFLSPIIQPKILHKPHQNKLKHAQESLLTNIKYDKNDFMTYFLGALFKSSGL